MLVCATADRESLDGPHSDEAAIYRLASAGDHDAQVEMAGRVLTKGMAGALAMSDAILLALQWTNMASTSGKARHALAYAGVVMIQASEAVNNGATEDSCEDLFAEALAIIDKVASAGHGRAELVSLALAGHMTAQGIAKAQARSADIIIDPLSEDERREDEAGLDWIVAVLGRQHVGGE